MSTTEKRSFRRYNYEETDTFTAYLNEMAREGWFLKKMGFGMLFEKGEPEDACYDVQVFPKGKDQDFKPEKDALDMAALCEGAGWKLVDGRQKFCVYRKTSPDAVPIVTPEEKYQNIRNAALKESLTNLITFGLLALMYILEGICLDPGGFLLNGSEMTIAVFWVLDLLLSLGRLAHLIGLLHKWKGQLDIGQEPFYGHLDRKGQTSPLQPQILFSYFAIAVFLFALASYSDNFHMFAVVIAAVFIGLIFCIFLTELRPGRIAFNVLTFTLPLLIFVCIFVILIASAETVVTDEDGNVISEETVSMEVSGEENALEKEAGEFLPFTASDYMIGQELHLESYDFNRNHSCLGSSLSGNLFYLDPDLDMTYSLYDCRCTWTADLIWNHMTAQAEKNTDGQAYDYNSEINTLWNADAAVCDDNSWYVRKGNRIFYFNSTLLPDSEEISLIAEMIDL